MKNLFCKSIALFLVSTVAVSSLFGCSESAKNADSSKVDSEISNNYSYVNTEFSSEDLEVGYDETSAVKINLNKNSVEISGSGAKADGSIVTISDEGVYVISGELTNGRIIVDTGDKKKVRLIMCGADITCKDNAPIFVKKADKVIITFDENSENSLTDGASYNNSEEDSNVDGALFSRSDLTLNGSGKLTINANYKHAIVCKDSLIVAGGEFDITSNSGGVYGKDSVRIKNGTFNINAGSNGIRATNSEEDEKGYNYIKDGTFTITAENDGMEAVDVLRVDGRNFKIETGGGSSNASVKENGERNENWGNWGKGQPNGQMKMPDDNMAAPDDNGRGPMGNPPDDMRKTPDINNNSIPTEQVSNNTSKSTNENSSDNTTVTETSSAKALKADKDLLINGGKISVDSSDDSVHSNGNVIISGGELTLSSGDDGVHADSDLKITGGKVTVAKSYEGLEGVNVKISGGEIDVTSSDDGINAAGGSDTGSEERMGRNEFSDNSSEYVLSISGGKVKINANGDGLDSNGNLIVEGGEIYISGPSNDGNGALDYGDRGEAWITGGTIVACGTSGMAEGFGENNSTQNSVLYNFSSKIPAGTEVKIIDNTGNVVLSYTPDKDYQSVVFSCPNLENGKYTVSAGDISDEITIDSVVTSNGSSSNRMGRKGFNFPDQNS